MQKYNHLHIAMKVNANDKLNLVDSVISERERMRWFQDGHLMGFQM